VDHELHATRFVEEPLGNKGLLSRQSAEEALGFAQVLDQLMRGGLSRGPPQHLILSECNEGRIYWASSGSSLSRSLATLGMR
jgi:hypothetical protein